MSNHPDPFQLLKSIIPLSTSSLPIEEKLDQMIQSISGALGSDRCLFLRPDKVGDHGFLSDLVRNKKSLWVDEGSSFQTERILSEEEPLICPSFACIPLYEGPIFQGILYMGFSKKIKFSPQEVDLFLIVAKVMEGAIRMAHLHQKEGQVEHLSTLWELNKALLTTVNFERMVHMTLTAITLGDGFGFNRAMLFLLNGKNGNLEGTMAVGPDSAEEAGRIWTAVSQKKGILSDLITELSPNTDSLLNSIVKGIRIPLEKEQCILSRTVLEGRSFNIQFPQSGEGWLQTGCEEGCRLSSEVGCYVSKHPSRDPQVYHFATVPVWGKGKVIGVILVDNLYNQNPITEEDIHFLTMFSNQAGLAIENALLYRNLEEVHRELKEAQNLLIHQEKMVALGELSTTIAHELKNPLTSIGGFARRLYRAIPEEARERKYTQTIMIEVARLERILSDLLAYTHDESTTFVECDLRKILEDCLSMVSEGFDAGRIQIVKEFSEDLPKIKGDYHQLKQAFFNLISNSYQAMNGKGTFFLRASSFSKNGSLYIKVEVEDTGYGIDPENLHNIFNPFYSTKESSLGLGLPIVHKIITSHQGKIEVDNHPGKGVNFIITFPAGEGGAERFNGLS
jgi:two-component system sensor histidine kinase HydH